MDLGGLTYCTALARLSAWICLPGGAHGAAGTALCCSVRGTRRKRGQRGRSFRDRCPGVAGTLSYAKAWASVITCTSPARTPPASLPVRHRPQVRIELYDRRQTRFISAHTNALSCLVLSMDGKRLATASDKGTLVRVWHTADGTLLQVGRHEGLEGLLRGAAE